MVWDVCVREKKLPSLHNNAMYVHPRPGLASVCVRAHGPKLQRTTAKERGERNKGKVRKGPRRGHGIIVFPSVRFLVFSCAPIHLLIRPACLFPSLGL
jgi:hypothetical protein